jgi:pilus assembly protein CpaF
MGIFRKEETVEQPLEPEKEPVEAKVEEKEERDPMFFDLEPEPPGTPPQRGFISEKRAAVLRLQLQIADHLRQSIAPDVELDLPLERTPEREKQVVQALDQFIKSGKLQVPASLTKEQFYQNVANEVFDYGPIQPLLGRDDFTEVMVNSPYIVFAEMDGRMIETGFKFLDDDHVVRIIKRIVLPLGRSVLYDHPLIDARLPDGSRVNAVIPPCSLDGPNITIRKFSEDKLEMEDIISFGSLTEDMATFLEAAVVSRLNILVSGGTGSGKTTLINILSRYIPSHERTVTIEDAAELQLQQRNVVRLETKKPSPESETEMTIRDCVINSLRMRPERIVVGECRGPEALDMLQAMNTGHDGSMTTIHSNSPRDCISRLETLVLMAGVDLPVKTIRSQIASAINLIVQASRLRDGSRKVTQVTEVMGLEGSNVVMQDIFTFKDNGDSPDGTVDGYHTATGMRPNCDSILKQNGFNLPASIFMKASE